MKLDRFLRLAVGVLVLLVFVIAIAAMLFVTESALNVWDRLLQGPEFLLWTYVTVMSALVIAAVWLIVRLVVKRKIKADNKPGEPIGRKDIETRLRDAEKTGVDVSQAQSELAALAERQESGSIHLCFFGEISTGKSSLIKALIPAADVAINPVGGSTIDIRHYRWRTESGVQVLLTDVPGTGGLDGKLDDVALEEAQRAQLVLLVCDGDLSRDESESVKWLLALEKPLILVMNKADRYDPKEQAILLERLLGYLDDLGSEYARDQVVAVSAGGEVDVIKRQADGGETSVRQQRPADIGVLVVAINRLLEGDVHALDVDRDRAVFRLAAEKLAEAEHQYRDIRAAQIIRSATRRAIVGALAAVSPGTDVIIQGYIGTTMTRELCKLFGATPRDLDIEEFLNLSQSKAGKALPLSLAVAGNALKAFPGVGTVAGGVVHAVAYGLIFDALGHSLLMTLRERGEFDSATAVGAFEEGINEQLEARVRQVARMAVEAGKNTDTS